ncbi:MAG: hypothetical protein EOM21_12480 [Gammaproteobacteria bacterium]|nr:hypothetical protein [Gammaproteobacteria bacterium]
MAVHEVQALDAADWLTLLEESGALVRDAQVQPVSWRLAPPFVGLLNAHAQQLGRRLCFAVPEYRAYLLGILAEGLADAGRAGMTAELEAWTEDELALLLPELNGFIDHLERGVRLVDLSLAELERRMADSPERAFEFDAWDSFALGQSARPKALFEFALRRFAPASAALPVVDETVALLRALPLNREDGFDPDEPPLPCAWNIQRFGVLSSAALFDARGRPLFGEDSLADTLVEHLRDALVTHPFYAALIHLAICAWRSPASTMPKVELDLPSSGALHELSILVGSQGVGLVADLLGDLVRAQGYAPFGLVDGRVPDDLMGNLLRNLLELHILCRQDEQLVLHEDYRASLMAARLRTVFRPSKALQQSMVEALALRAIEGVGG